jgi:hypothetical protein
MAGITQLVEYCVVAANVRGSNPLTRPFSSNKKRLRSSGVEQGAVNSKVVGSNPIEAVNKKLFLF